MDVERLELRRSEVLVSRPPGVDDETERLRAVSRTGLTNAVDITMERLAGLVARLLRTEVGLVTLVDDRRQFFPGQAGLASPWCDLRETLLAQSVCRHVVEMNEIVQIDDAGLDPSWAGHESHTVLGVGSYLGAPLLDADGRVLGCLSVFEREARAWTDEERAIVTDLAFGASADLRSRIAARTAELSRHRVDVMADVTAAMLSTVDPGGSITAMLDVVVHAMARWALVFMPGDDEAGAQIFVRHRDPEMQTFVDDLELHRVFSLDQMPMMARVLAGKVPNLLLGRAQALAIAAQRPHDWLADRLGHGSVIVVPMALSSEIIGTLVLVADQASADFDGLDLTVAGDVGRRAAMAFDHARIYEREKRVARELQQSLLPRLPCAEAFGVDAAYAAASHGVEVGGDWYDLIELDQGSYIAAIGDVTGHNIRAAAAMGRVQVALRLFVSAEREPAKVVDDLETAAPHLLGDLLATCLVVRLEPLGDGRWLLDIANAGHVPPLVIPPTGDAWFAKIHDDPLLGIGLDGRRRRTMTSTVGPGTTVLLYTDGLVEHRGEQIDVGLERLRLAAMADREMPVAGFCNRLVRALAPSGQDDIACIAMRF